MYFCDFEAVWVKFTVVNTVDSSCAFVAAIKQSALFAEFRTRKLPRTCFGIETKAFRFIKMQCSIIMTLKLIFQGKKKSTVALRFILTSKRNISLWNGILSFYFFLRERGRESWEKVLRSFINLLSSPHPYQGQSDADSITPILSFCIHGHLFTHT